MDILTLLEDKTERYLSHRKGRKEYNRAKKRTFFSELRSWVDALLFAIFWVIIINQYVFQLFLIPSPSMVYTLNIGDRVLVNKDQYGVELYPAGKKIFTAKRKVQRDDIITFYNPEYETKGPVFDILSQIVYMATLTFVNIDKNEDGTPAERLYVKRAVGLPGDIVKFINGNLYIKASGEKSYIGEEDFRKDANLSLGPNRTTDENSYIPLYAASVIDAYYEEGVDVPLWARNQYSRDRSLLLNNYDYYDYDRIKVETAMSIRPQDFDKRSEFYSYDRGIYVPEGYVLPLGDNRDNSHDGRYFGPVNESRINGRVVFRFWPLSRVSILAKND